MTLLVMRVCQPNLLTEGNLAKEDFRLHKGKTKKKNLQQPKFRRVGIVTDKKNDRWGEFM
jgi:hypothetical protein